VSGTFFSTEIRDPVKRRHFHRRFRMVQMVFRFRWFFVSSILFSKLPWTVLHRSKAEFFFKRQKSVWPRIHLFISLFSFWFRLGKLTIAVRILTSNELEGCPSKCLILILHEAELYLYYFINSFKIARIDWPFIFARIITITTQIK
jgi:hypothetical protein